MDPDILKELLSEFITETSECLGNLETDLLSFEGGDQDEDAINRIFRIIHTIKGSAGSLAFTKMESVSHEGEQLLDKVRSDKLELTTDMVSVLLELLDVLRNHLVSLQETEEEADDNSLELKQKLKDMHDSLFKLEKSDDEKEDSDAPVEENETEAHQAEQSTDETESVDEVAEEDFFNDDDVEIIQPDQARGEGDSWGLFFDSDESSNSEKAEKKKSSEDDKEKSNAIEPVDKKKEARDKKAFQAEISETTIRVEIKQLDNLMSLVGELVLTRNQLLQKADKSKTGQSDHSLIDLDHITSELQQSMMQTRMQPIGNAWAKLPRIVRDLAMSLGKDVRLEMEGKDTELDRSLIEAIKDPLLHLVRNSVDHGIESPETRMKSGKDAQGLLCLSAYHESGQVHIDIIDDGAGINVDRVKAKALQSEIVTASALERMSDREIVKLIFQPGFSTAEQVSNVSGRGVGMDVVRSNIEKIGGSIDIQTHEGQGTSLKLKIPLTLAIIPAVIVGAADQRFAIPQLSLQELVMLEGSEIEKSIETLYDSKIYRLRGEIIPIVFLSEVLGLPEKQAPEDPDDAQMNIVVLSSEGQPYGLVVDQVFDTEEIVVKPLSKQLKQLSCFSGATIMGDGSVSLILDAHGFGVYSNALGHKRRELNDATDEEIEENMGMTTAMLLFNVGAESRMAVPLADVDRVEEVESSRVERVRGMTVVQRRGKILKLVDLAKFIPGIKLSETGSDESLNIIVYTKQGRSVGVIVSEVLDIVNEVVEIQEESNVECLVGSLPLAGKVTEILDLDRLMELADPLLIKEKVANHG